MAFNGTLIAVGGTPIPYKYIFSESYSVTPNQRMEQSAKRVSTGVLHRVTASHTATKIEFETPTMYNNELNTLVTMLNNAMSDRHQRKLTVTYFDPETNSHKTGECYMPDIQYKILKVDVPNKRILYAPTRIAFIEY